MSSIVYANPEDERTEVRLNCGNTGESNLPELDIDNALSMADDETTERTGLGPTDPRQPHFRRKMKILIASAYLMIRFSDLVETRTSLLKEIENITKQVRTLESTDADDESLIDDAADDNTSFGVNTELAFWGGHGGTRRSRYGGRRGYGSEFNNAVQDYRIIRIL